MTKMYHFSLLYISDLVFTLDHVAFFLGRVGVIPRLNIGVEG